MKLLRSGTAGAGWDHEMVRNLSFIKKRLRYPISRYTALPVMMLAMMLPALCLFIYFTIVGRHHGERNGWPQFLVISMIVLVGIVAARRYWQTLHFIAIPTPYFNTDNQIILLRFLQSQHFAFARHPDAPEVFQIMSKNISTLKEEREIVVFIADDKRILINSHFTQTGSNFAIGVPHHLQMARMLQAWMNAGGSNDNMTLERSVF